MTIEKIKEKKSELIVLLSLQIIVVARLYVEINYINFAIACIGCFYLIKYLIIINK